MDIRIYKEPTTIEFLSALNLLLSNQPRIHLRGKDQYNKDIYTQIKLFNGSDNRRYIKDNHDNLYCSSFIISDLPHIYFGDTDKPFCNKADLTAFLLKEFNKSKNNKKRTFLAVESFRQDPSFKTAKAFLSLYEIKFNFGSAGSWGSSHIAKIADFSTSTELSAKTEKNKIRDELRKKHNEIKCKELELLKLKDEYNSIKASLNKCE